ncbi:hypothetical protein [Streptomyces sp. NBC_00344]|uniref:hypothetical protein n=1 Tax=Streptomyces sp. NBC_00344 TaxID=2975720 RepID=UPI002E250D47
MAASSGREQSTQALGRGSPVERFARAAVDPCGDHGGGVARLVLLGLGAGFRARPVRRTRADRAARRALPLR